MLTATNLRNNTCFEYLKEPYKVLKYKHTHMGRGQADIKVKIKNLMNNKVLNVNFESSDKFEEVILDKKQMQYLYQDKEAYVFMDPVSFEQVTIEKDLIGDIGMFLKDGEEINILFWQDKPIDIDMLPSVVLEIIDCDPGVKGNSASNVYKDAVLKNGLKIRVPLFIKKGDKVKVDTRTQEYLERVS